MRLKDPPLLAATAAIGAMMAIAGQLNSAPELVWLFTPLTTLLIVWAAWRRGAVADRYAQFIFVGLLLSLVGDLLMIPRGWHLWGVAAMTLAHLAYLRAFTADSPRWRVRGPLLACLLLGALLLYLIWPRLHASWQVVMSLHLLLLCLTTAQAHSRARLAHRLGQAGPLARQAALGMTLLFLAGALLALSRFWAAIPLAPLWILVTYWAGQVMIALSIPVHPDNRTDTQALA
ncbi:MAG: lysoplasmalogenase family protein [Burkholderiaceae bacterium]